MKNLLAADANFGQLEGFGPLGTNVGDGVGTFSNFLSSAVGLMTIIAIIWFVFVFFTGAIGVISAGSDKQALEAARKKISTGVIGLVVTIAAVFIIDLLGYILGFGQGGILNLQNLFGQIR